MAATHALAPGRLGSPVGLPRSADLRALLVVLLTAALVSSVLVADVSLTAPPSTIAEDQSVPDVAPSSSQTVAPGEVPDGLTAAEWADIQAQIAAQQGSGAVTAAPVTVVPSPIVGGVPEPVVVGQPAPSLVLPTVSALSAAGVDALVTSAGVTVGSVSGVSGVTLSTASIGDVTGVPVTSQIGDRVELAYGSVTEYYQTVADGIEHGYVVDAPVHRGDELVIHVTVGGGTPGLSGGDVLIAQADGSTVAYRDLYVFDASGAELPATMGVFRGQIVLTVDTAGATYPITVDPTITATDQKLLPAQDAGGDLFGEVVAIDADATPAPVAVISARLDDDRGSQHGTVYILRWNGSSWVGEATLYSDTSASGDDFGWDVDVDDDLVVVGAPNDDDNGTNAGAVYGFTFNGTSWSQRAAIYECDLTLTSPCGEVATGLFAGHRFGSAVAVGVGGRIAIGAPLSDNLGAANGAAYVYSPTSGGWETDLTNDIPNPDGVGGSGQFGWAVDLSADGDHLVVGNPFDDGVAADAGSAWYVDLSGGSVGATTELAGATAADIEFGHAVAVDLDTSGDVVIVVGAPGISRIAGDTPPSFSSVYFYAVGVGSWPSARTSFASSGTAGDWSYGRAVDFDGTTAIIGRPTIESGSVPVGDALLNQWDDGANLPGSSVVLDPPTNQPDEQFGAAVAVDGPHAIVGAFAYDELSAEQGGENTGRAFAYNLSGAVQGSFLPIVANHADEFGRVVAQQGDRLAVSAINDDAAQVDGGVVYMFERSGSAWVGDGVILSPEPEFAARFGDSLDVFGDRVAVGESDRLGDLGEEGKVYVFERAGAAAWVQLGSTITRPVGGPASPDAFGQSVAFLDNDNLFIGAPEAEGYGEVYGVFYNGSDWDAPALLGNPTPDGGDLLGFDIDVSATATGYVLAAGAPGYDDAGTNAGAVFIYEDDTGTGATFREAEANDSNWSNNDRVGTAVAVSGDTIAVAGIAAGTPTADYQVHLLRRGATNWDVEVSFTDTLNAAALITNAYLDLVGENILIGRPGGGGEVEIYRDANGDGTITNPDEFIPTDVAAGDNSGTSISTADGSLVFGAPGDDDQAGPLPQLDDDSGAAYSIADIALTHIWTGAAGNPGWGDPDNWDTGLVPDANDTAIIPAGSFSASVSGSSQVGVLWIGAGSTVSVTPLDALTITGGSSGLASSTIAGILDAPDGAQLTVQAPLDVTGTGTVSVGGTGDFQVDVDVDAGLVSIGATGIVDFDADVTVANGGDIQNAGQVDLIGETLLISNASTITNDGTWHFTGTLDQSITLSNPFTSSFTNNGTIQKSGSFQLTLPSGLTLDMTDGSALDIDGGHVLWASEGTWTGAPTGVTITADTGTTMAWNGSQSLVGYISGSGGATPGRVTVAGTKTWLSGTEPNVIDFAEASPSTGAPGYMLASDGATFTGAAFEIWGYLNVDGASETTFNTALTTIVSGATVRATGIVSNDPAARIQGSGPILNQGRIEIAAMQFGGGSQVFTNEGTFVADTPRYLSVNPSWVSTTTSIIEFRNSPWWIDMQLGYTSELGLVRVFPGANVDLSGAVAFGADAEVEFIIDGPSSSVANYGYLRPVAGAPTLQPTTTISTSGTHTPTAADSFNVLRCEAVGVTCPLFSTTNTPGYQQLQVLDDVHLIEAPNPCDTEWTNTTGNNLFADDSNWTAGAPESGDVACMDLPGALTFVDVSGDQVVGSFFTADERLNLSTGASLTIENASTLTGGVSLGGSLIALDTVTLAAGSSNQGVSGGAVEGDVVIDTGATITVSNLAIQGTGTVLTVDGNLTTFGDLDFGDGADMVVNGTLDFNVNSAASVVSAAAAGSTIDINGTLTSRGTEQVTVQGTMTLNFTAGAAVDVSDGIFEINASGTWDGSTPLNFEVEDGATARVGGDVSLNGTFTGSHTTSSPGTFAIDGATLTATADVTLDFPEDISNPGSIPGFMLEISDGDLDGFTWTILDSARIDGSPTISGALDVPLGATVGQVSGTVTFDGSDPNLAGTWRADQGAISGTASWNTTDTGVFQAENGSESTFTIDIAGWTGATDSDLILAADSPVTFNTPAHLEGGDITIGAGSLLTYLNAASFGTNDWNLAVEGASGDAANYGRVDFGTVAPPSLPATSVLNAVIAGYSPVAGDSYLVAACGGISACPLWGITNIGSLTQVQVGNDVALQIPVVPGKLAGAAASDAFGSSVDTDGDLLVVGSPGAGVGNGAISIFRWDGADWVLEDTISGSAGEGLGTDVAVDDQTVFAGAPDSAASGTDAGAVYVYRDSGGWSLTDTVTQNVADAQSGDQFGLAVDVANSIMFVGAPGDDEAAVDAGAVYRFNAGGDTSTWGAVAEKELASDAAANASLGFSVAVRGRTAVAGAPNAGTTGQAYVFFQLGNSMNERDILVGSDSLSGDGFGWSVATAGNTIVVGAPDHQIASSPGAGAAYLFTGEDNDWVERAKLENSTPETAGRFGSAIDAVGDLTLVGAEGENSSAGRAYVFERLTGNTWTQQGAALEASDGATGDLYGTAVAISADHQAIGAWGDDAERGGVYYAVPAHLDVDDRIVGPGIDDHDQFGFSIDIDGTTAIVGAPNVNSGLPFGGGTAFVFTWDGSAWVLEQELVDPDPSGGGEAYGYGVSVSGDTAVVGSWTDEVWVWTRSGSTWTTDEKIDPGTTSDVFGAALDLDGTTLLVGAHLDDGTAANGGTAYVYVFDGLDWVLEQQLSASNVAAGDRVGFSVAVDGDTAVLGAPEEDGVQSNAGAIYVFQRSGSTWTQTDFVNGPGAANGDVFGTAVAISGDLIAVGAPGQNITGSNNAGWVHAYELDGSGAATLIGSESYPASPAGGAEFGSSVAIDGNRVVAGAETENASPGRAATLGVTQAGLQVLDVFIAPDNTGGLAEYGDRFGQAVAISGDLVLVGASEDDTELGGDTGSAYAFTASPFVNSNQILAADAEAADLFGQSVAIHDDWMVVGARLGGLADGGKAYVFSRTAGGPWVLDTELEAPVPTADEWFGQSVAISGTIEEADGDLANFVIAVGAPDTFGAGDGSVYLYRYDAVADDWAPTRTISAPSGAVDFGAAVDLQQRVSAFRNGSYTLVVGAPALFDGANAGQAFVYNYTVTENPSFSDSLTVLGNPAPGGAGDNLFGYSVAVDRDTVIVGERAGDPGGVNNSGSAYVYRVDPSGAGSVTLETTLAQPVGDAGADEGFGHAVDIDGDLAVVTAFFDNSADLLSGAAWVYERTGTTWSAPIELASAATGSGHNFGLSARVEDGVIVVGSQNSAAGGGVAQVFTRSGATWAVADTFGWFGSGVAADGGPAGLALYEDGTLGLGFAEVDVAGLNAGGVQIEQVAIAPADGKLVPQNTSPGEWFGTAIATDGEWAVVAEAFGTTEIYRKVLGTWTFQQELAFSIGSDHRNAAIGGGYLALEGCGTIELYEFDGSTWISADSFSTQPSCVDGQLDIDAANQRLIYSAGNITGSDVALEIFDLSAGDLAAETVILPVDTANTHFGRRAVIDGDYAFVAAERDAGGLGVANSGSVRVFERSPGGVWSQIQSLQAPDGNTNTRFGSQAVDAADGRLIVSEGTGNAWVFRDDSGTWVDEAELPGPSWSVAIDGDLAAVGRPNAAADTIGSGLVRVYEYDGSTWSEQTQLVAADAEFGDAFGDVMTMNGTDLFVGARLDSNGQGVLAGGVYTFELAPAPVPPEPNFIPNPTPDPDDFFGTVIDIDGQWMVVGAYLDDDEASNGGAAYVYEKVAGVWEFRQTLGGVTITSGDAFGFDVAVDGDLIVVGTGAGSQPNFLATYRLSGGVWTFSEQFTPTGATSVYSVDIDGGRVVIGDAFSDTVFVYDDNGTNLVNETELPDPSVPANDDFYGYEVGISGDVIAVGAPFQDNSAGVDAGAVYVWEYDGSSWQASQAADPVPLAAGYRYGHAISVRGDTIAAGMPGAVVGGDAVGGVVVLDGSGTSWDVVDVLTGSGSTDGSLAGLRAGVSLDTGTIVFGASRDDTAAGADAGVAYVFQLAGSTWSEVAILDAGDAEAGDFFGLAVGLDDGSVAVGVALDPDREGGVYTFEIVPGDDPSLIFDLGLQPGQQPPQVGGGTGIPISVLGDAAPLIEDNADNESSVGSTGLQDVGVAESALAGIQLADTPFSSIAAGFPELANLPLLSIGIDAPGGWAGILANDPDYLGLPLVNITVGQVFGDPDLASTIGALPFSSIEVNGTPFSSIPFSSIAMGEVPIDQIPLFADRVDPLEIAADWCAVLAGTPAACTGGAPDPSATLMSIALSDVPFSSIPFSSIPFSSIPIDALDANGQPVAAPFSSIPLSQVNLGATPFSSIPFSSIPFSSIPVSTPFSSIPFSSIPFSSIPFSSIPFSSIGVGPSPFSSIPFSSIDFDAIDVNGVPFSSIPFSSILLADVTLDDIPLDANRTDPTEITEDWCALLGEFNVDCTFLDLSQTTITDVGVRGVPFSSIPFSSIPFSSITVTSAPFSSIPFSSIPFSSIPLGAIDLTQIELDGTPFSSIPFSSIAGPVAAPFSSIPFSSIDVQGSPFSSILLRDLDTAATPFSSIPFSSIALSDLPFSSIPFSSIPFSSIDLGGTLLSDVPFSSIDLLGSPFSSIPFSSIPFSSIDGIIANCALVDCENGTLGDAVIAGALVAGATLGDLEGFLDGYRLPDVANHLTGFTPEDVENAVRSWADTNLITLATLLDLGDLALGDLPVTDPLFQQTVLGDIVAGLTTVTFADLAAALLISGVPNAETELENVVDAHADANNVTIGTMLTFGDITFGDILPALGGSLFGELGSFLAFIHLADLGFTPSELTTALGSANGSGPGGEWLVIDAVNDTNLNLGDILLADLLNSPDWGLATVRDLIEALPDEEVAGFTLADLLLGLLPEGTLPWGLAFENVDAAEIPGVMPPVTLRAEFQLTGNRERSVEVSVELPSNTAYLPGTTTVTPSVEGDIEPSMVGGQLVWTLPGIEPGPDDTTPGLPYQLDFDVQPTLSIGASSIAGDGRIVGAEETVASTAFISVLEAFEPNDTPPGIEAFEDTLYLVHISSDTDIDLFYVDVNENDSLAIDLSGLPADFDLVVYSDLGAPVASTALSGTADGDPLVPVLDPDADGTETIPDQSFPRLDLDPLYPDLALVEISNSRGTEDETIVTDRLPGGRYIIQVHGHDGASSPDPAVLQVQIVEAEDVPVCQARGPLPVATPGSFNLAGLPAGLNTIFLVNEQRFDQLYPTEGGRTPVITALNNLITAFGNDPEISQLGLVGAIVPVDADPLVRDAFARWDDPLGNGRPLEHACNPATANEIVSLIIGGVVDDIRQSHDIEHIVMIGSDDLLPFARLTDATVVANEFDYRHDLTDRNAFTSSFWASTILSDDPYGETAAVPFGDRFIYLPDAALGRLLETPAAIEDQIDRFIANDGFLAADSGFVAGYDFLIDGSEAIGDELATIPGISLDRVLEDGTVGPNGTGALWSRQEIFDALIGDPAPGDNGPDIVSFNAHFDHYRALPAEGDQVPGFSDNFEVFEIDNIGDPDALLDGSLVYSMGCHSGLNVPNTLTNPSDVALDWAEAFAAQEAIYVGNTGFGYGDTETVGYTERLLQLFSRNLATPVAENVNDPATQTSIGQALQFAKQEAFAELPDVSVYHEKALQESTMYGLPFYRLGVAPVALPAPPDNNPVTDPLTGTLAVSYIVDAQNDPNPVGGEIFYSNVDANGDPSTVTQPGRPIQPTLVIDVTDVAPGDSSALERAARGAIILDMTSSYVVGIDPVVSVPVFDEASQAVEPDIDGIIYPTVPQTISTFERPEGTRQNLVLATGQYRGSEDLGTQRLDDAIDVVVYYSNDPDRTAPSILEVDSVLSGTQLGVTVDVDDGDGSGVDRVYVLVTPTPNQSPAEWFGIDLVESSTVPGRWVGGYTFASAPSDIEFLVQVKDEAGNVGVSTNKAVNFGEEELATPDPVTLDVTVTPTVTGDPVGGIYRGPVQVAATAGGLPIDYDDGGGFVPFPDPGPLVISGEGLNVVDVRAADGQTERLLITIDTTPPVVTISAPVAGQDIEQDSTVAAAFSCQDPSPSTCVGQVTGPGGTTTLLSGEDLPSATVGTYTLLVTGTDSLGQSDSDSVTYDVVAGASPPVITTVTGPLDPVAITDAVTIEADFTDDQGDSGSYTVTIDYGDADPDVPGSTSTLCTVTTATPTVTGNPSCALEAWAGNNGGVTSSFTYAEPGVYTVTVTITDEDGLSDDSEFEQSVVVYDPTGGRVTGSGWFWSDDSSYVDADTRGEWAYFAYRARYVGTDPEPRGRTRLWLPGDFNFRSTAYDYLIIDGTTATAEGVGRLNGQSGYRFRVQGIDDGSTDFLQITIWDSAGDVVYDNGVLFEPTGDPGGDEVVFGGIRIRS